MYDIKHGFDDEVLTVFLSGHIDSLNAQSVEDDITKLRGEYLPSAVVIDCAGLEYISSAGLRVILRIKKAIPETKIVEVNPDVYEIFDVTGFTEMMDIQRAYRVVSVDGCEVIGRGANGIVFRLDRDTVVKSYKNPDALPEIQRERELARTAFVLGVPTAIPYDVVRIKGGGYGSVFELLDATSCAKLLISGQKSVDEIAKMSADLLKLIHSTTVKPDSMPDMKKTALGWAEFLKDHLSPPYFEKLISLIKAVPDDDHMLHGDYHIKNVMVQNGESLLIDMDTLCHGHPVFEFASMFNAYRGFSTLDHDAVKNFIGIDYETACELWYKIIGLYIGSDDEEKIKEVERRAQVVGYTRLMRREIRRNGNDDERGRAFIEACRSRLEELLDTVDTLVLK